MTVALADERDLSPAAASLSRAHRNAALSSGEPKNSSTSPATTATASTS
jgi:hypothetical protein